MARYRIVATYRIQVAMFIAATAVVCAQSLTEYGAVAAGTVVGGASGKAVSQGVSAIFGKMNDQTVQASTRGEDTAKPKPAESAPAGTGSLGNAPVGSAPAGGPSFSGGTPSGGTSAGGALSGAIPVGGVPAPRHAKAVHTKRMDPVDTTVPPPPPPRERSSAVRKPVEVSEVADPMPPLPFNMPTLADVLAAKPILPPPTMTPDSFQRIVAGMSRREVLSFGAPSVKIAMVEDGHMVETFSYRAAGQRYGRLRLEDGTVVSVEAH